MKFTKLEKKIIDTPEFQQLRVVKQLGQVFRVYPTATHSRFEHSLAVCHKSGHIVDVLSNKNTDSMYFSDQDKQMIRIAGLCHDLGHCVDSHEFDDLSERLGIPENMRFHENRSCELLCYITQKYQIELNNDQLDFICDVIRGNARDSAKSYLFEIVANRFCETESDKEYLLRDSYYCGFKRDLDFERMYTSAKILKCADGKFHIVFHEKVAPILLDMFQLRQKMFTDVYFHPTAIRIKTMMADIHERLNNIFDYKSIFALPDHRWRFFFTDHIYGILEFAMFHFPLHSPEKQQMLKEAHDIYQMILRREFYPPRQTAESLSHHLKPMKKSMNSILLYKRGSNEIFSFGDMYHTEEII